MPTKAELVYNQDFLRWETNPEFTRGAVQIKNTTGATANLRRGLVLEVGTSGNAGSYIPLVTGSSAAAILLDDTGDLANNGTKANVLVLLRGPALINVDAMSIGSAVLPTNAAGALAAAKVALAALGIQQLIQPVTNTAAAG